MSKVITKNIIEKNRSLLKIFILIEQISAGHEYHGAAKEVMI